MKKSSVLLKASLLAFLLGAVQPLTGLAEEIDTEAKVDEPYEEDEAAQRAVWKVLTGKQKAVGHLPVSP